MMCNTIYSCCFCTNLWPFRGFCLGRESFFYQISYTHTYIHTYIHTYKHIIIIQYTWKKNGNYYSKKKGFVSSRFLNESCHAHCLFVNRVCTKQTKKIDLIIKKVKSADWQNKWGHQSKWVDEQKRNNCRCVSTTYNIYRSEFFWLHKETTRGRRGK